MKHVLMLLAFVTVIGLSPSAVAQENELPRFAAEGRFGVIGVPAGNFLDIGQGNHFSIGGLFSYRPINHASFLDRLTLRGSLDGAGLGGQDVATGIKDSERLYLLNLGVGLDVIRLPRLIATIHGGGAVSRDHLVLQEFSQFGGSFGSGGFVGACNFTSGGCQSTWNLLGNEGIEGRFIPRSSWSSFFLGVDYTHFPGSKNQTMVTTGLTF